MEKDELILKLLLLMAFADKKYMEEEKDLIFDISKELKISNEKVDNIINQIENSNDYTKLCRDTSNLITDKSDREKTLELLGCDGDFLKSYLESTKVEGKDYTNAHIDHIIPCDSFDMSDVEQRKRCFHYTNLQLLPAHENLKKSNKII